MNERAAVVIAPLQQRSKTDGKPGSNVLVNALGVVNIDLIKAE